MTTQEKIALIKTVSEEIVTEDELENLLLLNEPINHYIGFEISGKVHLGTGLMTMRVIKELQKLGVNTSCFLADWHSFINNKLGGDMEIIREMALSYFKEALIASALCVGVDPRKINFVLANDIYKDDYWMSVIDIASNITISRGKRSLDIAGRVAADEAPTSLLFYPAMQVADIFYQGINLAHAGTDQRKAHVVARAVADKIRFHKLKNTKGNTIKPIAIHHHLLQGLTKPPIWPIPEEKKREMLVSMKMSKSKPDSAVFIHDSPEVIEDKIKKAFCPPNVAENNPIIDWTTHIIFPLKKELRIERAEEFGGSIIYTDNSQLIADYEKGSLHPNDLKSNVARVLIEILEPARQYFSDPKRKAALEKMEQLRVTR